jgi:hypothetical protein
MLIGIAQADITPEVGCELSGFAARTQPSTGVLDPLLAKALYLVDGDRRLLWIQCDLVGLHRDFVQEVRNAIAAESGLGADQILVAATHTHSGPTTVPLHEAGQYDPVYVGRLAGSLRGLAAAAMTRTEPCGVCSVEGRCDLAIDRRGRATAHTDPRVGATGFRRADGSFVAVLVNYPMHAVALGSKNRRISADWPGRSAAALTRDLPGNPMAVVSNGACGNLNPPFENVSEQQLDDWGARVVASVGTLLADAPILADARLAAGSVEVPLPLDWLDPAGIDAWAARSLQNVAGLSEWGDKFRRAIGLWRQHMTEGVTTGRIGTTTPAELFAVRIADRAFLGINAELFSRFTDLVRESAAGGPAPLAGIHTVGYANGDLGYVATSAAYDEGGYELEIAHLFYDAFRPRRGGLEMLAERAGRLLREIGTQAR